VKKAFKGKCTTRENEKEKKGL
jgi:hypothetical protein